MLNVRVNYKTKRSHWHIMESLGDSIILVILRVVLLEIFGHHSSLAFLKLVEDHAKSTQFIAEIAKYYNLQRWCSHKPRDITEWANLCEAWVGAVFLSESMWADDFYKYTEIAEWFKEIWMIRYRGLFPYITKSWLFLENNLLPHEKDDSIVTYEKISYPDAPCFQECKMYPNDKGNRYMGFLATAHSKVSNTQVAEFSSAQENADQLARRSFRTRLSELNSPMKNQVSRPNRESMASERVFPFSAQRSNTAQTVDVFSTYRRKCFDVILSFLCAENPSKFPENLLTLSHTYQSWLESLPADDPSNLKTRAMLSWNLVSSF